MADGELEAEIVGLARSLKSPKRRLESDSRLSTPTPDGNDVDLIVRHAVGTNGGDVQEIRERQIVWSTRIQGIKDPYGRSIDQILERGVGGLCGRDSTEPDDRENCCEALLVTIHWLLK